MIGWPSTFARLEPQEAMSQEASVPSVLAMEHPASEREPRGSVLARLALVLEPQASVLEHPDSEPAHQALVLEPQALALVRPALAPARERVRVLAKSALNSLSRPGDHRET